MEGRDMKTELGIRELPAAALLWLVDFAAMAIAVRTGLQLGVAVAGFWAVWAWLGRRPPAFRDARRAPVDAGTRGRQRSERGGGHGDWGHGTGPRPVGRSRH